MAGSLLFSSAMSYFVGWVCIGLAAALAACILPFRRGLVGVAANAGAGALGAAGAATMGMAFGLFTSPRDPVGLFLAALGALALLALLHAVWRVQPARRRAYR